MSDLMTTHTNSEESTKTAWISVKDKLPDEYGIYLAVSKGAVILIEFDPDLQEFGCSDDYQDELGYTITEWYSKNGVTHWMPIPELPGGNNDV